MAELILTDAEKAAETWFELPDEVVGKLTKYSAAEIRKAVAEIATERDMTWELAAAMMLIDMVRRAGMTELNQHIEGYSYAGTDFGDWKITITKVEGQTV